MTIDELNDKAIVWWDSLSIDTKKVLSFILINNENPTDHEINCIYYEIMINDRLINLCIQFVIDELKRAEHSKPSE